MKDCQINMLLADDENTLRMGIASLPWKELGINLLPPVKNGLEAISAAEQNTIDILLTDIRMPIKSGTEVAEIVRKLYPDSQIIFLSGYSDFEYARKAISLSACDYILKPSTPNEIISVVTKAKNIITQKKSVNLEFENLSKLASKQRIKENDNLKKETDIKNIISYIGMHYQENITLTNLANYFHFSSVYLSRFIKKHTGYTFTELLTNTRMYHAACLLRETNLRNADIADRIGMNDERYFGQVFQKTFGMSPVEYRKNKKDTFNLKKLLFGDSFE